VGNTIEITPYINSDRTITLEISQESSSLKRGGANISVVTNSQVLSLPIDTITSAELTGTVIAKDGLTIAIGGLVRETNSTSEQRVPGLSDVPIIGNIFTSVRDKKERSELILMITPRVMMNPDEEQYPDRANEIAESRAERALNEHVFSDELECREACRL